MSVRTFTLHRYPACDARRKSKTNIVELRGAATQLAIERGGAWHVYVDNICRL